MEAETALRSLMSHIVYSISFNVNFNSFVWPFSVEELMNIRGNFN